MRDVKPQPDIIDGVPRCSLEDCPLYDGKRCEAIGARPGDICEPVVGSMSVDIDTALANLASKEAECERLREDLLEIRRLASSENFESAESALTSIHRFAGASLALKSRPSGSAN